MSLKLRVAVWSPENREFGQPFSYDHLGMSIKQWKFPGGEVGIKLDGDLFDDEMYDILVDWQAHDFSLRGQSNLYDGASCAGHLTSFRNQD